MSFLQNMNNLPADALDGYDSDSDGTLVGDDSLGDEDSLPVAPKDTLTFPSVDSIKEDDLPEESPKVVPKVETSKVEAPKVETHKVENPQEKDAPPADPPTETEMHSSLDNLRSLLNSFGPNLTKFSSKSIDSLLVDFNQQVNDLLLPVTGGGDVKLNPIQERIQNAQVIKQETKDEPEHNVSIVKCPGGSSRGGKKRKTQ